MDREYLRHRLWAIANEDGLLDLFRGTPEDAMRHASQYGRSVLDAYGEREQGLEEPPEEPVVPMAANPRLPTIREASSSALRATGLPRIDLARLLKRYPLGPRKGLPLGDGLAKAHAELVEFFPKQRLMAGRWQVVERWSTPEGMAEGLLRQNFKTMKPMLGPDGRRENRVSTGLNLLPAAMAYKYLGAGEGTFCRFSTPQCRSMCLVFSGQNPADRYNVSVKLATARALLEAPEAFCRMLLAAVHVFACDTGCRGERPYIRPNIYSDIPWERFFPGLFEFHKDIDFYDYTKVPGRKVPPNYDLTFSYSGTPENIEHCKHEVREAYRRIAVVFMVKKDEPYPPTMALGDDEHFRLPIIRGDEHDLRPLEPGRVIVGLRWRQPFARRVAAVQRTKGFYTFVVPVIRDKDGNVIVAEANRFTDTGERPASVA